MSKPESMLELLKMDAARWVQPEEIAPIEAIDLRTLLTLLYRYIPLRAMAWFRLGNWCQQRNIRLLPRFIQRLLYRHHGLDIWIGLDIGGGLYIAHPIGSVIVAEKIGQNCTIIGAITIGMRKDGLATIGNNVYIGAGARILGGVTIGDEAKIGANAVVISDIPAQTTAVGIPAKVVRSREVELV